jgi:hypothetical protein
MKRFREAQILLIRSETARKMRIFIESIRLRPHEAIILGSIIVIVAIIFIGSLTYKEHEIETCRLECRPYKSYFEYGICRCAGPDLKVLSKDERCRNLCHPYTYNVSDSCKCLDHITKTYNETN